MTPGLDDWTECGGGCRLDGLGSRSVRSVRSVPERHQRAASGGDSGAGCVRQNDQMDRC